MKTKLKEWKLEDVNIYAVGVCYCSVCAPKKMSIREVTRIVNIKNPAGPTYGWRKSKDKKFNKGDQSNPCECENDKTRRHILFNC